jgi:hypothetical protein
MKIDIEWAEYDGTAGEVPIRFVVPVRGPAPAGGLAFAEVAGRVAFSPRLKRRRLRAHWPDWTQESKA